MNEIQGSAIQGGAMIVPAGVLRRFAAMVLDGVVVLLLSGFLVRFALGIYRVGVEELSGDVLQILASLAQLTVGLFYHGICLFRWGMTPGRRILGVRVVDGVTLGSLSLGQALGRTLATHVSMLVAGIGYLMAAFDGQKRTLHDRMAGTRAIRVTSS